MAGSFAYGESAHPPLILLVGRPRKMKGTASMRNSRSLGYSLLVVLSGAVLFVQASDAAAPAKKLVVKVYDVRDLIPQGDSDGLAELCMSAIAPDSWDEVGGEDSLDIEGRKMTLRQTQEVHALVGSLLTALRKLPRLGTRKARIVPKKPQIPVGDQLGDKKQLRIVVYPIGHLLRGGKKFVDFDKIIERLTTTVEPKSWNESGGSGSIDTFENRGALVISNTKKAHNEIGEVLAKAGGRRKRR